MVVRLSSFEEEVLKMASGATDTLELDSDYSAVCKSLKDRNLIEGTPFDGGFLLWGITPEGKSYFADLEEAQKLEEKEKRSSRLHDYKVASFGIIGGGIMGALAAILLSLLGIT